MAGRPAAVARAYARVVASPGYFPLWLGQLISSFGDALHSIALVVLVFRLTGQGLAVAGLVAAESASGKREVRDASSRSHS